MLETFLFSFIQGYLGHTGVVTVIFLFLLPKLLENMVTLFTVKN